MHKDILTNMKKGILLASLLCGVSCLSSCSEEPLSSVNQDYPIVISFYRYYEWGEDVLSDEFLANNEVFLTKGYEEEFVIDYDWIEEMQRECNIKHRFRGEPDKNGGTTKPSFANVFSQRHMHEISEQKLDVASAVARFLCDIFD